MDHSHFLILNVFFLSINVLLEIKVKSIILIKTTIKQQLLLSSMDVLGHITMKNAASCDKRRDLQISVNN